MIRLRIERLSDAELKAGRQVDGLLWYENSQFVGRVIIEQNKEETCTLSMDQREISARCEWVPVEVIDDV